MTAYYNEVDPFAAAWLRELIKAGAIAPGDVDEKDIRDVRPDDLRGYTQCHFFAGIGVWSYALRLAGWTDNRPVWTGSCPCQPFSAAGKRGGAADERHLWPHWHHLIRECRPAIVLGEQVASKDGLGWLDLVSADMEGEGYAFGASDLCAAGVGAPHIRQRLWFVGMADADDEGPQGRREPGRERAAERPAGQSGVAGGLADASMRGREPCARNGGIRRLDAGAGAAAVECGALRATGGLADSGDGAGFGSQSRTTERRLPQATCEDAALRPGPTNGFWRDADWLGCRDGKWRPVEPGTFPLAHGAAARVGRLRGYGNAIVSEAARTFIESVMDATR
jgi:DNA (cytosine-5)-methyltransferase 1